MLQNFLYFIFARMVLHNLFCLTHTIKKRWAMRQIINEKINNFKKQLHNSDDFSSRVFVCKKGTIGFVFLKSMSDPTLFSQSIYLPIQNFSDEINAKSLIEKILKNNVVEKINENGIITNILDGKVVIFSDFFNEIISVDIAKYPTRIPSEPPTSPVIQGPREGFVEDFNTNITLLRRRIHSKDLVFETLNVGKVTQTKVVLSYIEGIADQKVIDEIKKKISKIKIDGIVDSYYILSFLEKRPNSLFKQIGNSEKPDIVVSKMLEGKVAIIVDNSPIVLTVPFILIEDMQSSNDYYTNHHYSTVVRLVRMFGLLIAIVAPGFYLALQLFHYNILPLNFLITIANTTQGLPFTPFLEILFIFLLFQILYEVSLRLPSYLGLATSVVGALILGDTGVKAGLISPPGVIITALAKIALYTVPEEQSQITVLQIVFIILGGSLGILGIVTGFVYVVNYLNTLDDFNSPYLAPYAPRIKEDLQDALIKVAPNEMKSPPKSFSGSKEGEK